MCFPLQGGFETTASFLAKCGSEQDFLLGKIETDLKGQNEGRKRRDREERREVGGKTAREEEIVEENRAGGGKQKKWGDGG